MQSVTSPAVARLPRAFLRVAGPDAADYLQRMVSNDVEALDDGNACDALLLTAKARVIAPLRIIRRGRDDFLLLTEPELGETVRAELVRMRFAAKVEIEPEAHESWLVLGGEEVLDEQPAGEEVGEDASSSAGGSSPASHVGAVRSTTASCRQKPASTKRTSASARAAIQGRSRSPGSTTEAR